MFTRRTAAKPATPAVEPEMLDHVVTAEDLEINPDLVEQGVKVGETIQIPKPETPAEPEIPETKVSSVPHSEVKIEKSVSKTDSGILVAKDEILKKETFYAKKEGKNYLVVNGNGEVHRVYRADECEDPQGCAESYAKKLSSKWHQ